MQADYISGGKPKSNYYLTSTEEGINIFSEIFKRKNHTPFYENEKQLIIFL